MKKTPVQQYPISRTTEGQTDGFKFLNWKVIAGILTISLIVTLLSVFGYLSGRRPYIEVDNVPPSAAFLLVLGLLLINAIGSKLKRTIFTTRTIVLSYWIATISGLVAGRGFLYYALFVMMSWQRVVVLEYQNIRVYGPIYKSFSSLILPKDRDAIKTFWLGDASVPWGEWLWPIILWSVFFVLVYMLLACVTTLFVTQWINIERLQFPLTKPITEVASTEGIGDAESVPFWKHRWSYVGIILGGLLIAGLNGLHHYFPGVPTLSLRVRILSLQDLSEPLKQAINQWPPLIPDENMSYIGPLRYFKVDPLVFPIAYFVNLDVLFSVWVFVIAYIGVRLVGYSTNPNFNIANNVMITGGFSGLLLYSTWIARAQILDIIKAGVGLKTIDDRDLPFSFRVAFWGGIFSFILLVAFVNVFFHLDVIYGITFFLIFVIIALSWARVRGESGIPLNPNHGQFWEYENILRVFGSETMGTSNIAGLSFLVPLTYGIFGTLSAVSMEAYKSTDDLKINRRQTSYVLFTTVVATILFCFILGLIAIYHYGGTSMFGFWWNTAAFFTRGFDLFAKWWKTPDIRAVGHGLIGVGIVGITAALRSMFMWFPLHPVGFILAIHEYVVHIWQSFFLMWIVKVLLTRYGGRKALLVSSNFFIGLILGQVCVAGIFSIIGIILGY